MTQVLKWTNWLAPSRQPQCQACYLFYLICQTSHLPWSSHFVWWLLAMNLNSFVAWWLFLIHFHSNAYRLFLFCAFGQPFGYKWCWNYFSFVSNVQLIFMGSAFAVVLGLWSVSAEQLFAGVVVLVSLWVLCYMKWLHLQCFNPFSSVRNVQLISTYSAAVWIPKLWFVSDKLSVVAAVLVSLWVLCLLQHLTKFVCSFQQSFCLGMSGFCWMMYYAWSRVSFAQ